MHVQPYLFFDGRCDEAIEFYKQKLGAEVGFLMRYKENPDLPADGDAKAGCVEGDFKIDPEKIMHAELRIGETMIMVSDGMCGGSPKFEGVSLTLNVKSEAEAEKVFAALADGGQIQMPLEKTFFSPKFGMLADRFGVGWLIVTS